MLGFGRFRWRTVTGGSRALRRRDSQSASAAACTSASASRAAAPRSTASTCAPTTGRCAASTRSWSPPTPTRRSRCSPTRATTSGASSAPSVHRERRRAAHRRVASCPGRRAARASWNYRLGEDGRPHDHLLPQPPAGARRGPRLLRHAQPSRSPASTCSRASRTTTRSTRVETLAAQRELPALSGRRPHLLRRRALRQRLPRGRARERASRPRAALGVEW